MMTARQARPRSPEEAAAALDAAAARMDAVLEEVARSREEVDCAVAELNRTLDRLEGPDRGG